MIGKELKRENTRTNTQNKQSRLTKQAIEQYKSKQKVHSYSP